MVDSGNPFGAGREITHTGTKELPLGAESVTGYMIINADSLDEAEEIAKTCTIITSIRVYISVRNRVYKANLSLKTNKNFL